MSAGARICLDDRARRTALRATDLNGLDYLEVDENDRHRLHVFFISKLGQLAGELTEANFVVSGGLRVREIEVNDVDVCQRPDAEEDDCVTLTVDHIGDFSTYTLCVMAEDCGRPTATPHPGFDPVYACLDFSFQAGCPSPLDCRPNERCAEPPIVRPDIDYLAKDYASFRQVLLDRLGVLMPGWNETHEPDLLVTLVELLAYEGDRLSYLQDAVATEAYIHTARRRISIRRHARLVDYHVHEGCNARAWVFVEASQDSPWLSYDDVLFITGYRGAPRAGTVLSADNLRRVPEHDYEVFEPLPEPAPTASKPARPLEPAALCRRVRDASDPAAGYVRRMLSSDLQDSLKTWTGDDDPASGLAHRLLDELDRLTREQDLGRAKAFSQHRQTGAARHKLARPLRRSDLVGLNWLLLRSAFEDELAHAAGLRFYESHNRIVVHTWGKRDCCLPGGTTAATLVDAGPEAPQKSGRRERRLHLAAGDWLLFEEVRDPRTGLAEDADVAHRHVVRLTHVASTYDPVLELPLLEVEWGPDDALPFPLCLSSRGPAPECEWLDEVSVARGNVLLVDHGRRELQELDAVELDAVDEPCDECRPEQELVARRYRPVLAKPDLTFAQPLTPGGPATGRLVQDPHKALPHMRLQQVPLAPPRLDVHDPLERYRNPVPLTAFDPEDLVSPAALVERLQKAAGAKSTDPLGSHLRGLLDKPTRQAVDAHVPGADPSTALVDGLLRALNDALDDEDLYQDDRFPRPDLDEPTQTLLDDRSLPLDLRRLLRRWLLEQALSEALAQTARYVRDWWPRLDLLASTGDDRHFVVEMTDDRRATLRFGDDELGHRPDAASRFRAHHYRAGSGPAGNVGAETIAFLVRRGGVLEGLTLTPRNPLPAAGGTGPETLDEARQRAPYSIHRDLARAVIAPDYAALAARDFASRLQGAAAELVWTGSWYEANVTLDPWGREDAPPDLLDATRVDLDHYRRMGHALRVAAARYVPLEIVVVVCVKPSYQWAHVRADLEDVFTSGCRADGQPGFFHPDNLRFRSHVDVSDIVAQAQAVEGVLSSRVPKLERLGEGDAGEVENGTLPVSTTEIPRVDSRNGFPEFGSITFETEGGR